MSRFCGHCGTPREGRKFCTGCGHPLEDAETRDQTSEELDQTRIRPAVTAPAPTITQPAYATAPASPAAPATPVTTAAPRPNPFAGVPLSDYARDAGAIVGLFACLGMPWDALNDGGDLWWVVISVLVALASLLLPYVGSAGLIAGWTRQHVQMAKFAAVLPFAACVVTAVINTLINIDDPGVAGLGTGIGAGLFGVTMAVQPRRSDEDLAFRDDPTWVLAWRVATVLTVVLGVLAFAGFVLDDLTGGADLFDDIFGFAALVVLFPLMFLVVVGGPALAALGRSRPPQLVLATTMVTVLVVDLLALGDDGDGVFAAIQVESWNSAYAGTFVLGVAAALTLSRPVTRAAHEEHPALSWILAARMALRVAAAASALVAVVCALRIADLGEADGALISAAVTCLVLTGIDVAAAGLLADVRRNRTVVLAMVLGALVVGITATALVNGQDLDIPVTGWVAAAWFALPLLALYALVAAAPVRAALGPVITPRQPPAFEQGQPQYGPTHPDTTGVPGPSQPPYQPPYQPPSQP